MFSRPKILFLVSLLFVALLNPKFNPYLPFKFLIFYHSSVYSYAYIDVWLCCSTIIIITYIASYQYNINISYMHCKMMCAYVAITSISVI